MNKYLGIIARIEVMKGYDGQYQDAVGNDKKPLHLFGNIILIGVKKEQADAEQKNNSQ